MRDILKIEDLPAGVSELAGEELEAVAGFDVVQASDEIQASMQPGTPWLCSSLNNGKTCDRLGS
ncbi:hypothetical protein FHS43_000093 [Streptosporangium becharense]|uniref:Uncharacterized protein n=1 Tax=Streptosporangium becharense TaxID=1816182 RepID=A0A7W9MGR9_9ACTN|nr:hypothetical protein [Streptosporangium becharense]MBB2908847.1 hypothetical protein [Streptosporangium becharense]MBB5820135.1 hypothetical protein [Streptosporangium becharense]